VIWTFTVTDPPTKPASIQSSGVRFGGILSGAASVGVPAFGGMGTTSDSTNGGFDSRDARLGGVVSTVVALAGRGGRVKHWVTGETHPFGRQMGWALDKFSDFRGMIGVAKESKV